MADAAAAAISAAEIAACFLMAHSWSVQEREAQQARVHAETGDTVDEEAAAVAKKHAAGLLGHGSIQRLLSDESGSIAHLAALSPQAVCSAMRAQWTSEHAGKEGPSGAAAEEAIAATPSDWRRCAHAISHDHASASVSAEGIPQLVGGALDAAFQLDTDGAGAGEVEAAAPHAGRAAGRTAARSPRGQHQHQQPSRSQRQRAADRRGALAGTAAGVVSELATHALELLAAGAAQSAVLAGRRAGQPSKADVVACVACIAGIVDPGGAGEVPSAATAPSAAAPSAGSGAEPANALTLAARASGRVARDAVGAETDGKEEEEEYGDEDFESPDHSRRVVALGAGFAPIPEAEGETGGVRRSAAEALPALGAAMVEAAAAATAAGRRAELRQRERRAREREGRLQVERAVTRREQRLEEAALEAQAVEAEARAEARREQARLRMLAGDFQPSEEAIRREIARLRAEKEERRKAARELRGQREQAEKEERSAAGGRGREEGGANATKGGRRRAGDGDSVDKAIKAGGEERKEAEAEEDEEEHTAAEGGAEAEGVAEAEADGTARRTKARHGGRRGMSTSERLERQQAVFTLRAAAYQDAVPVPGAAGPKAERMAARRLVPRIKHNNSASAAARAILRSQVPATFHTMNFRRTGKAAGKEDKDPGVDAASAAAAAAAGGGVGDSSGDKGRGPATARGRLRGAKATKAEPGRGTRSRSPRPRGGESSPRKRVGQRQAASPTKRQAASPKKREAEAGNGDRETGLTVVAGRDGGDGAAGGAAGEVAATPQARGRGLEDLSPGAAEARGRADADAEAEAAGAGTEAGVGESGIVFTVTEDGPMPPLVLPEKPAGGQDADAAAAAVAAQWAAKGSPRYHAHSGVAAPAARLRLAARTYNAPQPERPDPLRQARAEGARRRPRGGSPAKHGEAASKAGGEGVRPPRPEAQRPKRPQGHRGARGGGTLRTGRSALPVGPATSEDPGFERKAAPEGDAEENKAELVTGAEDEDAEDEYLAEMEREEVAGSKPATSTPAAAVVGDAGDEYETEEGWD